MEIDYLGVFFRWLHILAAITAVGGSIFARVALMPSLTVLGTEQRQTLFEAIRGRWSKFVAGSILFLLISGVYNIMLLEKAYRLGPLYHALFGIKFILAFIIFFIASLLSGRSAAAQRLRQRGSTWLTVNVVLAVILVCISGVLRALPHPPKAVPEKTTVGQAYTPAASCLDG